MEILRSIRLSRGRSVLRKKVSQLKRQRFRGNIKSAKSIGIVWDAENTKDFGVLSQFHQKMAERNIDVKIIGYYPGKELPDKLTAVRYFNCLKPQDLNITYRPVSPEFYTFVNIKFDILIDTNYRNIFPLEYISSVSAAGLKVGIFENGYLNSPFDIMLEVGRNFSLNDYLDQVVHYLEMINTGRRAGE